MYKIFKNTHNQNEFEKQGYSKFKLLDESTIQNLTSLYEQYTKSQEELKNSRYGMHISLNDKGLENKKKLIQKIQDILQPKLSSKLDEFKLHLGGFLTKMPDSDSFTYPHQDWTFVDNEDANAFSATIWISLTPLSKEQGSLGFINGSHKLFDEVIGSPSPATWTSAQQFGSLFFDYLNVPQLEAGEALMFNNKTIHGAFPNTSSAPRVAIAVGVTPKNCALHHYTLVPGKTNEFKKLKVEESFFVRYMNEELFEVYQNNVDFSDYDTGIRLPAVASHLKESDVEVKIQELGNTRKLAKVEEQKIIEDEKKMTLEAFFTTYTPKNIYNEIKYRLGL